MTYLSEEAYQAAMTRYRRGELNLSVPKIVARQFFTHVGNKSVQATSGTSILLQKLSIGTAVLAAPVIFLFAMSFIYNIYSPGISATALPIVGITWTVLYGLTSDHGGWYHGSLPLLASIAAWLIFDLPFTNPLLLFVFSLWLQRATYLLSQTWLEELVASSYPAFEILEEHVTLTESSAP